MTEQANNQETVESNQHQENSDQIENKTDQLQDIADSIGSEESDHQENEKEEVKDKSSLEELPLPEEESEEKLTKEDYILRRKEKQLRREKEEAIAAREQELERVRKEKEEAVNRARMIEFQSLKPPSRDDFSSEEEYLDAHFNHNLGKMRLQAIQESEQKELARQKEYRLNKLQKAEDVGHEKYADFGETVSNLRGEGVITNAAMVDAIIESDFSADILYMLGKHPEARKKLNDMSPIGAVKEIAKLELRFKEAKMTKAKATSKPLEQLKAKPISAEGGKKELTSDLQKKLAKLSPKEFEKAMEDHLRNPATRGF
jgi:hypothetical protein